MKNVIGSIRPLVNGRGLQLEWARIFHETLLVPVLINKEKERSRIRDVQMNNVRGLLGIRKMDRVPNALIRELCGVTKGVMKMF